MSSHLIDTLCFYLERVSMKAFFSDTLHIKLHKSFYKKKVVIPAYIKL